jgi:RNA polymerase sigma factor (sigma-70 family)
LDEFADFNIREEETDAFTEERIRIISKTMESLSSKCKEILTLFYFHKLSMSQIAAKLGYGNDTVVKTKKYKCMGELRKRTLEDPEFKELLR